MPKNRTQLVEQELQILAIRRVTTKIAIKLFENATNDELIAEVNLLLSQSDFSYDLKQVEGARVALIALAKKLGVDLDGTDKL